MEYTFGEVIKTVAEYEVEVSKAQYMFEAQTGLKLDKMTDFLMKFIYLQDLKGEDVTMTVIANTLMVNENTIRTKIKHLAKNKLIVCNKCGADSRTKVIKPTKFLKSLIKKKLVK